MRTAKSPIQLQRSIYCLLLAACIAIVLVAPEANELLSGFAFGMAVSWLIRLIG